MKSKVVIFCVITIFILICISIKKYSITTNIPSPNISVFVENFDTDYILTETNTIGKSANPKWWLSSGAYLYSKNGIGSTVSLELPRLDLLHKAFLASNPIDTDNGDHPQNIFRLITKDSWQNIEQKGYFQITKDNLSGSSNRNASNGLFFFNRYQDAFNVYYTGLRVDGYAVIKKKIDGIYYTMAYKPFIKGIYDRDTNPDLLPKNTWIGLKSIISTNLNNTVDIQLFIDFGKTGNWILVAHVIDDGKTYNTTPILNAGHAGIRTDFMDVQFDDYQVTKF